MAKSSRPCGYAGCSIIVRGVTGFCMPHMRIAFKCAMGGCENRVAAFSRSRCCEEHRVEGAAWRKKGLKTWE